jgi:hypothetical protein
MVRPRFTIKIFLSYIIIIAITSLSLGIFSTITLKNHYIKNIEKKLETNALLVKNFLSEKSTFLDRDVKKLVRK